MILSDISVKRPVFATVISLLLLAFGTLAFMQLPLREYPDTSPPVVSISTNYPGASAAVVETQITKVLEGQINGIAGVANISSQSSDERSNIAVELVPGADIEAGANDIREKISRVTRSLPQNVDPPQITKTDNDASPLQFFNLMSSKMNFLELNDYAKRYIYDQFLVLDGVATIMQRGNGGYAMRIWIDRAALAARGLTVTDITNGLRKENVEVPAGRVESAKMEFTVNVKRLYNSADDFAQLVISRGKDGHLVRLGEVAKVELGAANPRSVYRGNGVEAVGLGIIKQSTANSLAVMRAAAVLAAKINASLPEHMQLLVSSSDATFIEAAIHSVYETIIITMVLVSAVVYLFLGSLRATLIPVVTIPVCMVAAFILMALTGISVNLITLLALVLSVGLIVDDSIVVLENVQRRIEAGEPPLLAAFNGSRQVAFAVIATTVVMVAVFVPVVFLKGNMGILLFEMAVTIGGSILFSALLALTLTPMMSSKLLTLDAHKSWLTRQVDRVFRLLQQAYREGLETCLRKSWIVLLTLVVVGAGIWWLLGRIPSTFAPNEDQGVFMTRVQGPEGANLDYMEKQMTAVQDQVLPYVDSKDVDNELVMIPANNSNSLNSGQMRVTLPDWDHQKKTTQQVMDELSAKWAKIPGLQYNMFMRSGLGSGGGGQPVQFVIGGRTYEELAEWRDLIIKRADESGMFVRPQSDYQETRPTLAIAVDKQRAADLGVSVSEIGETLKTMMSETRVTTFVSEGEEYDVILEAEQGQRATPDDLSNINVRSDTTGRLVPLSNLVTVQNSSGPNSLNRYNQIRAITISAGLAPGVTLDKALAFLEGVVHKELPEYAQIDYKGESRDLKNSSGDLVKVMLLSLLVVFLVLAAQFESFIHPLVIMTTVPLAIFGAFVGLYLSGGTLNIYSNIGLVILVGIASKNGILIVEFANQLRDEGKEFREALLDACCIRLRPVLMTALATLMGAVPLALTTGAGWESRSLLGIVIFSGVLMTTLMTLFVVPVIYWLIARNTGSPEAVSRMLKSLQDAHEPPQVPAAGTVTE
ncbi:MAG TPA: efflux RND transporter permease subunit [Candidatus Acidoferrum sp.]|nr:efflux RND transporter permease subunit [Candidatus Acidoferrum sp.]